jgi:hypothetical protein
VQVVDPLELVEVHQQQRDVLLAALEQLAGDDVQVAAVVQPGHLVVVREVADPELGGALLRERRLELHRPAPGEQQQRDVEHERRGELGRRRRVSPTADTRYGTTCAPETTNTAIANSATVAVIQRVSPELAAAAT